MSGRSAPWRPSPSIAAQTNLCLAAVARMLVLARRGPVGFILKEQGVAGKHRVLLGDRHTCSCPKFRRNSEPCVHIMWVLLKCFGVNRNDPLLWQVGLVEREINTLLRGRVHIPESPAMEMPPALRRRAAQQAVARALRHADVQENPTEVLEDKELRKRVPIEKGDICPICQDKMDNTQETVFCRYGCGGNVHSQCLLEWAKYAYTTGKTIISCPLCREDFGTYQEVRAMTGSKPAVAAAATLDVGGIHYCTCQGCGADPVHGRLYRCTDCVLYDLCSTCFANEIHSHHPFQFRDNPDGVWSTATREGDDPESPRTARRRRRRLAAENRAREAFVATESVRSASPPELGLVPEAALDAFPEIVVVTGCELLENNESCRLCLTTFEPGEIVRTLPCRHVFHSNCVDVWLTTVRNTCPVDNLPVYAREQQQQSQSGAARRGSTIWASAADTDTSPSPSRRRSSLSVFGASSSPLPVRTSPNHTSPTRSSVVRESRMLRPEPVSPGRSDRQVPVSPTSRHARRIRDEHSTQAVSRLSSARRELSAVQTDLWALRRGEDRVHLNRPQMSSARNDGTSAHVRQLTQQMASLRQSKAQQEAQALLLAREHLLGGLPTSSSRQRHKLPSVRTGSRANQAQKRSPRRSAQPSRRLGIRGNGFSGGL